MPAIFPEPNCGSIASVSVFEDLTHTDLVDGGGLIGSKCMHCGQEMLGRRYACSRCASADVSAVRLPGSGAVYSFTDVHVVAGRDEPVTFAYVDLANGVRALTEIRPAGSARIGQSVDLHAADGRWWFSAVEGAQ